MEVAFPTAWFKLALVGGGVVLALLVLLIPVVIVIVARNRRRGASDEERRTLEGLVQTLDRMEGRLDAIETVTGGPGGGPGAPPQRP
jgi:Na+-transporting methylmalonyl-CoA/oxaloacetate decarboxylase gamma subunit